MFDNFIPMRPLEYRIELIEYLGKLFRGLSSPYPAGFERQSRQLQENMPFITESNPWFTGESIYRVISTWGEVLTTENIKNWASAYDLTRKASLSQTVLVIMAGNIPLVGFHDFLCTVMSGNKFTGKLSSRDKMLFPIILEWILDYDPAWKSYFDFTLDIQTDPGILIATGSNNTARLMSRKYSGRPAIIRANRHSIGLLTGNETESDLESLICDILWYYGLGCRNVSLLFIPEGFDPSLIAKSIEKADTELPQPYLNNLKYRRALAGLQQTDFIDAGKMLLFNNPGLHSPLGALHFSWYKNKTEPELFRAANSEMIQCSVGESSEWKDVIPFGMSQKPGLNEYADGVDTLEFLLSL